MYLQARRKEKDRQSQSDFLSFVKHMWPDFPLKAITIKLLQKKFNQNGRRQR